MRRPIGEWRAVVAAVCAACTVVVWPAAAIAQTGGIAGTVSSSMGRLSGAVVRVYDASETLVASSTPTTGTGEFLVTGLSPGTYFAFVDAAGVSGDFVDVLFPGAQCAGPPRAGAGSYCRINSGGPIAVNAGSVTSQVNFDLAGGGTIHGRIVVMGEPPATARVQLLMDLGEPTATLGPSTHPDAQGMYSLRRLPPGSYYTWLGEVSRLDSDFTSGFATTLWGLQPDVQCPPTPAALRVTGPGCSLANAVPVSPLPEQPAQIDFVPWFVGSIVGFVTGGSRPGSFTVDAILAGESTPASTAVASPLTGLYLIEGLQAGTYTVRASGPGLAPASTSPIAVPWGGPMIAPDLDLAPATPAVPPTEPASRLVVAGRSVVLSVTPSGAAPFSYQWYAGASGDVSQPIAGATSQEFTTPALLGAAKYWVRVSNALGEADSRAAELSLAVPGTGGIAGTVTSGGQPVANAFVTIFTSAEDAVAVAAPTSASGHFSIAGLLPGSYHVFVGAEPVSGNNAVRSLTASADYGYADVLYPNIACVGGPFRTGSYCRTNTGGLVSVVAGVETPGVDVVLPVGGEVRGYFTVHGGLPIATRPTVSIIVDDSGVFRVVATGHVDRLGQIVTRRLPAGGYRVAGSAVGTFPEVWNGVHCPSTGCEYADGTPIDIVAGGLVTGITFLLETTPPVITAHPRSQLTVAGQPVPLEVVATSPVRTFYQWFRTIGGVTVALPGEVQPTYVAPAIDATFFVRVTNSGGFVDSRPATVMVRGALGPLAGWLAPLKGSATRDTRAIARGRSATR